MCDECYSADEIIVGVGETGKNGTPAYSIGTSSGGGNSKTKERWFKCCLL